MIFALSSCKSDTGSGEQTEATQGKSEFLFEADSGNVKILSLNGENGAYVEKGQKDDVKNVAAITVRNDSKKMLEFAKISFKVNDNESATFIVSALPAGGKCVVMENNARAFAESDVYNLDSSSVFAYCEAAAVNKDVDISTEGSTIKVTNKTDAPLSAVISYKYVKNDMYYGGIAFNGKFDNIGAGETMEKESDYFNDDCRIVNVSVTKEK